MRRNNNTYLKLNPTQITETPRKHAAQDARRDVGGNTSMAKVDNIVMWRHSPRTGYWWIFDSILELGSTSWGSPYSYSQWTLYESILARPKLHGIRASGVVGSYHLPSLSVSLTVRRVNYVLGWPSRRWRTVTALQTGGLSQIPGKISCLSQYLHSRSRSKIEEEPVLPSDMVEDVNMREEEEPETVSAVLAIDAGGASRTPLDHSGLATVTVKHGIRHCNTVTEPCRGARQTFACGMDTTRERAVWTLHGAPQSLYRVQEYPVTTWAIIRQPCLRMAVLATAVAVYGTVASSILRIRARESKKMFYPTKPPAPMTHEDTDTDSEKHSQTEHVGLVLKKPVATPKGVPGISNAFGETKVDPPAANSSGLLSSSTDSESKPKYVTRTVTEVGSFAT
ncbi:hypothetical protein B0H14DRAFT_2581366 [Mycena olivaceomarginata]|nr:hypothetical protein B0H14DRAFT_2581366 [Mycena olivaceomarginata]